jgi:alpha-beta hydrolase superfamily lysophospholipase
MRRLKFPLLAGAAALVAAEAGRRIYRHSQIFSPSPDPEISWNPTDYGIPADAVEEHWIETRDGERLHAWYCSVEHPAGSALFCHGNTGNLTTSASIIPHLLAARLNVLLFDYRGFGKSSGSASIKGVLDDALTAAHVHDELRPRHKPSVLYGFSLGGAIASQIVHRHPFHGLILQSTFTSLSHLTRVLFPRRPMHLLAGSVFDSLAAIRRLHVPLLILHGTADEVIPVDMARELFDACPSPKKLHCVDEGLHKDIYERDCDSLVWEVSQFLAELPANLPEVTSEPSPLERTKAFIRRLMHRVRTV